MAVWIERIIIKYSAQYITENVRLVQHADACLDRQTTPTKICITSEDEGKNLEENDSQAADYDSLSRNDIAAIIFSAVNNNCRVIKDFSIKLNIRRGSYFEDFVKAFNKIWNIGKRNHKYCISFVGKSGIDTSGVYREFYSGISFAILFIIPYYQKILRLEIPAE